MTIRVKDPNWRCAVEGCDHKQDRAGATCGMHYQRMYLHGSYDKPYTPQPHGSAHPNWVKENPGYKSVHNRLCRERGSAKNHPCADCGEPALHWSYDYLDPNQLVSKDGPYSVDLSHYWPRCGKCHIHHDRKTRAERAARKRT